MTRAVRWVILVGAVVLTSTESATAGFISVALTAGADGSSAPSATGGFQFTNPTGSTQVGISDLVGVGSAQANTAGGSAFFGGLGVPVLLGVSDGAAIVSTTNAPAGAAPSNGLSSVAPTAPDSIPAGAAILSASLGDPTNGVQTLSVSVTSGSGSVLGSGTVTVPAGGWWVLGLNPDAVTTPPDVPPVIVPPVVPPVVVPPVVPPTPPTAATPEPTTLALAALGLPIMGAGRWLRRRRESAESALSA